MAFVGNAELVLFEIAAVLFVGFTLTGWINFFFKERYNYEKISCSVSWAPPRWVFWFVWVAIYLLMALAVYRIRTYGNWLEDVNLAALVVFWVLQFFLLLAVVLMKVNLWATFITLLVALALVVATTWLFFDVETDAHEEVYAGIFMLFADLWIAFLVILTGVIAGRNDGVPLEQLQNRLDQYMQDQATWSGAIGAQTGTERRTRGRQVAINTDNLASQASVQRQQQRHQRSLSQGAPRQAPSGGPPPRGAVKFF